ncbi:MAG TPA: TetR/AcrR family transcriptional regulator [Thermoleophilaceae bacterium]|nr:TetR/AcrR family transcriptional regulator [Thermoleophilaceae bacterium]
MSTPATPRKRLTAEARRAAILEAASAVFSARGYHSASIDDIAGEAGVSKALIYEHFASKQELHEQLVQAHASELYERLATAVPSADGSAARLAAGLDAFFGFVEERRDAWRMLFREAADPETVAMLDRMLAQVTAVVADLIAAEPGAQALPQDPEERRQGIHLIAQMLVGAAQTTANWWADHREVPREQLVETAMDFAWLGLDRLSRGERWTTG